MCKTSEITKVTVNHIERNYFDDYDEIRSDTMLFVSDEKVRRAIEKLVRRYRRKELADCLHVCMCDGSGWRLMYDYDPEKFDERTSVKELRLRHYIDMRHSSWDTEETVTMPEAIRRMTR